MQENRSFDSYFGTFPGADGIPKKDGQFKVCVPNPATGNCVKPFHNPNDMDSDFPHFAANATADVKQTLSFDAYVKFIEDDFLNSQRIDPRTDRRPDPRPDVRENAPELGDLTRASISISTLDGP